MEHAIQYGDLELASTDALLTELRGRFTAVCFIGLASLCAEESDMWTLIDGDEQADLDHMAECVDRVFVDVEED